MTTIFLRRLPAALLLAGSLWAAHPAHAQGDAAAAPVAGADRGETPAPLSKGEIKAMREFKMLDFNGDGKLSRREVALFPRLAAAFDEADTDGDGLVSYEEVRAFAAIYRAERDRRRDAAAQAQQPGDSPHERPGPPAATPQ